MKQETEKTKGLPLTTKYIIQAAGTLLNRALFFCVAKAVSELPVKVWKARTVHGFLAGEELHLRKDFQPFLFKTSFKQASIEINITHYQQRELSSKITTEFSSLNQRGELVT